MMPWWYYVDNDLVGPVFDDDVSPPIGNFNKTYGTLGAAIGFMMWMWISAIVILVGAELDAELQCQDPSMRKRPTGGLGREA